MFGSQILEVAIGLIFVFMLYSLFASAIMELISTTVALKARMLRKTIGKMLTDNPSFNRRLRHKNLVYRLYFRGKELVLFFVLPFYNSFRMFFGFKRISYIEDFSMLSMFYDQPGIKYLASSRPSDIKPSTFAKTLIDIMLDNGKGDSDAEKISDVLATNALCYKNKEIHIDQETLKYLKSLWHDAKMVPEDFKKQLISWYDETIERFGMKFKRYTRIYLFVIGYIIAITFNVDIISITNRLSLDDKARSEMVQLATAYISTHPEKPMVVADSINDSLKNTDSLVYEMKNMVKTLQQDLTTPNNLIAIGWSLPKTFDKKLLADKLDSANQVHRDIVSKIKLKHTRNLYPQYNISVCDECLNKVYEQVKPVKPKQRLTIWNKLSYLWCMATNPRSLLGFLITAIGISLGAPFWYELMQKLIKLRNSSKSKTEETKEVS